MKRFCDRVVTCLLFALIAFPTYAIDLLSKYPTTLIAGDTKAETAREWEFTTTDLFQLSAFKLVVGKDISVEIGSADLGLGHCVDGAVWAVVKPRGKASLTRSGVPDPEPVAHLWLRFHPSELNRLFPPETVSGVGNTNLLFEMDVIARAKMRNSYHNGMRAMIPQPGDMVVDADTNTGARRFFNANVREGTVKYYRQLADRPVKLPPPITPELAGESFDALWEAFNTNYAMFVLRPEVDWDKTRKVYRPRAIAAQTTYQFAQICAEMLRPLRDLHIWMTVASNGIPVYSRPREGNSNPAAHKKILGELHRVGAGVEWAITPDNVAFVAIYTWSDDKTPARFNEVLEKLRDTRGLIVDVRLNGGGSESLAMKVAGRFIEKPYIYSHSQYRSGPRHTHLSKIIPRTVKPVGPWRYDKPVVLLIGQKCMSSNESFIGMMTGDAQLTTMGDRTCGSSGNPRRYQLPLDISFTVPRWIDYLPDGKTPLDERGFQPQVKFAPTAGAFEGERDDLLSAALERLRKEVKK